MEHDFTPVIKDTLTRHFATKAEDLFDKSSLLQYINLKTVSATRGSKARSSFANLYAIYVLVEDYITHGYHKKGDYSKYEGAQFSKLFKRCRVSTLFPTPVSVLFPTFSVLNYKTHPVIMSITLFDNPPLSF